MIRMGLSMIRWLVFSNLFIALCAVVMTWQTGWLFGLEEAPHLLPFVFFATLCSYSFHWYLSFDTAGDRSRERWLKRYRPIHLTLLLMAIAGVIYYGMGLLAWWPWLLLSALVTFLYSAPKIPLPLFRWLRKVALGKTLFLALVWTHVTCILPLVMTYTAWTTGFTLFTISRFFLIYAICILFDLRDREHDRAIGIRSLITWLSLAQVRRLFIASVIGCAITTALLPFFGLTILHCIVLSLPMLATAFSFRPATRYFSDLLYYAWLDGLMALPAFIFLLISLMKW